MTKLASLAMMLGLVCFAGLAQATNYERSKIQLPEPRGYVSDHAQAIDGDWKERIRSVCQDLERKTGIEMVVVTVPSIKPFASISLLWEPRTFWLVSVARSSGGWPAPA